MNMSSDFQIYVLLIQNNIREISITGKNVRIHRNICVEIEFVFISFQIQAKTIGNCFSEKTE